MIFLAELLPGGGKWLAGIACGKEANISSCRAPLRRLDVAVIWNVGPAPHEDFFAVRVDLGEADGAELGPLGCEGEHAEAGTEVEVREVMHVSSSDHGSGRGFGR